MIYQYVCHSCQEIFEKSYHKVPKNPGQRKKHSCGELCERHYGSFNVHVVGTKHKVSNSDVRKALQAEIDDSNRTLANPTPYHRYYMTSHEYAEKTYGVTKVSEKRAKEKYEHAKKNQITLDKTKGKI